MRCGTSQLNLPVSGFFLMRVVGYTGEEDGFVDKALFLAPFVC